MKKKLIPFFVLISFLLTGCTIDYDIKVKSNFEVKESFTFTKDIKNINNKKFHLEQTLKSYEKDPVFSKYSKKGYIEEDLMIIKGSRLNDNLNSFANGKLNLYKSILKGATIKDDGEYISFSSKENKPGNALFSLDTPDPDFYVKEATFKIKFENKLIEHNADFFDNASNTATWSYVPNGSDKKIYFKVSRQKRYDIIIKDYITDNLVLVTVSAVLLIAFVIFSTYVIEKYQRKDRI